MTTLSGAESPILRGSATVWQDLDVPLIIRTTGPNTPELVTCVGNITIPQWSVNDYLVIEGQELVHGWKEGSTANWHIHLITNGLEGSAKYVAFEVEWAIATRFQAGEDLVVIPHVRGSTLDPSADQETALTTKLGVDATRPLTKPYENFELAKIPTNKGIANIISKIRKGSESR